MAAPLVAAGFSLALCLKKERTWRVVAIPTHMSAWDGALPGQSTATFSIIVPRLTQRVDRGLSARNTSGGIPNTLMRMGQRAAGLATMRQIFLSPSRLLPR